MDPYGAKGPLSQRSRSLVSPLRSKFGIWLSLFISVAIVAYIFSRLDWGNMRSSLATANYGWMIFALMVFILNYVFRTIRLKWLMGADGIPFSKLMVVTSLYGMFNYILPAKTGEVSFIVLLNRRLNLPIVDGASMLLASRFLDFIVIAILLPFVLLVYWSVLPAWLIATSLVFSGIVFSAIVLLIFYLRKPATTLQPATSHLSRSLGNRLLRPVHQIQNGLRAIYARRIHFKLLFWTAAIWLCVYTNFYLIILGLNYTANLYQVVVISVLMVPMTLLPFQGFANLGTHEIAWVTAFMLFGMPEETALSIAISSHFILLTFVLLLGASSLIIGLVQRNSSLPGIGGADSSG